MKKYIATFIGCAIVLFLIGSLSSRPQTAEGSVSLGSDYHATSTYAGMGNRVLLQTGPGALGSVVVTKVGSAGTLTIYDATSSSSSNVSTTTIATIPTNIAVGTYTFDVSYQYGLLVEGLSNMGTSTITFR